VAATTKCHGWELTDDGLQRSSARTCSKTESGMRRPGSKALAVRRVAAIWAMTMGGSGFI